MYRKKEETIVGIKVIKTPECSKRKKVWIQMGAILAALVITSLFIMAIGHNPFKVYFSMLEGALGTPYRLKETLVKVIPLLITALGIAVAFKMKFWNIGAEGQILMGAFGASYIALNFDYLPKVVVLTMMIIAGMICGGLWGLIPGYLKAQFNTNETIITLMMNYIALKWIIYLQYGPWKDPSSLGFPKVANFKDSAILPNVFGVHIGWILALILVIIIYIFLNHTKKGYEITVLGESENTARYAGIHVKNVILIAIFISGALAGLSGMIEASAVSNTLNMEVAGGMGYSAIIVAWLSGLSAPIIAIVAVLFAVLIQGGAYIQTAFQIPQSAADIIQAMILFCVLGSQFFIQYKIVFYKYTLHSEKGGHTV
jgi:simple sugar transport system permease protein